MSCKLSHTLVYTEHMCSTTESLLVAAIHLSGHRADAGRLELLASTLLHVYTHSCVRTLKYIEVVRSTDTPAYTTSPVESRE